MLKLMPIVYVREMARSLDFYLALGLQADYVQRDGVWSSLRAGDASLGLHVLDPLPPLQETDRVALALVSDGPLEALVARLDEQGVTPARGIQPESFGRSLLLRDPDGLLIQVNQHAH
ncbi:MAG: VOC family protein [Anaerolineae bacterium]|nr:VOC family protein [Anaerolineae bacterium]